MPHYHQALKMAQATSQMPDYLKEKRVPLFKSLHRLLASLEKIYKKPLKTRMSPFEQTPLFPQPMRRIARPDDFVTHLFTDSPSQDVMTPVRPHCNIS